MKRRAMKTALSDAELDALIRAVMAGTTEQDPTTEAEVERVWKWVGNIRAAAMLIDLALAGEIAVRFGDGEDEPRFIDLTDRAKEWLEWVRDRRLAEAKRIAADPTSTDAEVMTATAKALRPDRQEER